MLALFLLLSLLLLTLYLKLENLHSSVKNLQFYLYQLRKQQQQQKQQRQITTTNEQIIITSTTAKQKKIKQNKIEKRIFNKHWFDVTIPSQIKSTH